MRILRCLPCRMCTLHVGGGWCNCMLHAVVVLCVWVLSSGLMIRPQVLEYSRQFHLLLNGTWGPPEQSRTEGRHGRGGRLHIAAPANYRAASRLARSTTTRAASRGRCAAPPHEHPVTCTGRAARWARRAQGRRHLCRREHAAAFVPAACGAAAWQASDTQRGRALGFTQGTPL